jgi:hypothetical protein
LNFEKKIKIGRIDKMLEAMENKGSSDGEKAAILQLAVAMANAPPSVAPVQLPPPSR